MERRAPESAVADAMNRVLAAEAAAAEAIAAAQAEAEAVLESARTRRREVLEAARRRATRLHARGQALLRAALERQDAETLPEESGLAGLRAASREAVDALVLRLTSESHERP
jgi:vacuolar-type H+-ATPase subunit H